MSEFGNQRFQEPRGEYRVATFGLASRLDRLLEIVLRHARHNRYRFALAADSPREFEIAIIDMTQAGAADLAASLRRTRLPGAVITLGRRGDPARPRDDLLQASFTLNVLQALNGVVEQQLLPRQAQWLRAAASAKSGARASSTATPAGDPPAASVDAEASPATAFGGDASLVSRPRLQVIEGSRPAAGAEPRRRVLIVDDSPVVRRQLATALQQMGLDPEAVGSAQEAVDTLSSRRYALAFVDVVLPDFDGYRLTRMIRRQLVDGRRIPVIMLTSRRSPFDLARGALAGCNSYLVKPVTLQTLRDTVTYQLRHSAPSTANPAIGGLAGAEAGPH